MTEESKRLDNWLYDAYCDAVREEEEEYTDYSEIQRENMAKIERMKVVAAMRKGMVPGGIYFDEGIAPRLDKGMVPREEKELAVLIYCKQELRRLIESSKDKLSDRQFAAFDFLVCKLENECKILELYISCVDNREKKRELYEN